MCNFKKQNDVTTDATAASPRPGQSQARNGRQILQRQNITNFTKKKKNLNT